MSTKLSDLAEKLDIPLKDLKLRIKELGFDIAPRARVIEEDVAELVFDELKSPADSEDPEDPEDIAEIYDEMISEQREREIIKTQRKKTAGRDDKVKKDTKEEAESPEPPTVDSSDSVKIPDSITVKEFSEKTGINVAKVIGELMKNGILVNINQQIDFETAQVISDDLGIKLERIRSVVSTDDLLSGDVSNLLKEDDASLLQERPPVVCVMGHVDHGKTKLLDTIRKADVVSGESGGITQHIGAYQIEKNGKLITFLDTPGHEAFTAMRARGARVTDIAILVVAADEGMKPQTIEAMNHAKEAGVPIIVAINKIDKPEANVDKIKGELTEHDLQPEDWGGKTVTVPVSALNGDGIDELLEVVLLTAEIEELKANPDREAVGTVVEAHLDPGLGPVATILVNTGTLKVTDNVIIGNTYGRIKLMRDHNGKPIKIAGPSTPIFIAGLDVTPKSGDILQVVANESIAKTRAHEVALITKKLDLEKMSGMNQVISTVQSEKVLKIVLKADTKGSMEAIKSSIAKIKDEEVAVKIIHSGVGTVTESDIMMASASKGIVFAFHTDFDSPAVKRNAERENVEVKKYVVIYNMLEDVTRILSGLIEPEILEVVIGKADVKQIFLTKKKEMIIGCKITEGKLLPKAKLRVIRGKTDEGEDDVVGVGLIESLRKVETAVKVMKAGSECGIKYTGNVKVEEGDVLEAFIEEERQRTIS